MFEVKIVEESNDKEPKRLKYEEALEKALRSDNSGKPEIVVYY